MRILLAILLLFALSAHAQLQLYLTRTVVNEVVVPTTPALQNAEVVFPDIRENDMADLTFQIRNLGGASETISNVAVVAKTDVCGSGGGIAFNLMIDRSNPPGLLAGGQNYQFEVRYLPPKPQCYEAYLAVGLKTYVLKGSASGRTVMYEIDTLGQRQIINGSTSDFGNVRVGEAYTKTYRILNNTGRSVVIAAPLLSNNSGNYALLEAPEGTRTVPTDGLLEFKVRFAPTSTGLVTASLNVDSRSIRLTGMGLEAEVPNFTLESASALVDSNTQSHARVQIAAPAIRELSGTLSLRFEQDIGEMPDDGAIRFIASGTRSLTFRIPAGTTNAVFGAEGASTAIFATGTAAGKIRLVGAMQQWVHDSLVEIRSETPRLTDGSMQAQSGSLVVRVSGFDNTRSASSMEFRFFDANNQVLGDASGLQATVSDLFSAFYRGSAQGGQFSLRATFPVDGDASAIRRVEVILRNRLGSSPVRVVN